MSITLAGNKGTGRKYSLAIRKLFCHHFLSVAVAHYQVTRAQRLYGWGSRLPANDRFSIAHVTRDELTAQNQQKRDGRANEWTNGYFGHNVTDVVITFDAPSLYLSIIIVVSCPICPRQTRNSHRAHHWTTARVITEWDSVLRPPPTQGHGRRSLPVKLCDSRANNPGLCRSGKWTGRQALREST